MFGSMVPGLAKCLWNQGCHKEGFWSRMNEKVGWIHLNVFHCVSECFAVCQVNVDNVLAIVCLYIHLISHHSVVVGKFVS